MAIDRSDIIVANSLVDMLAHDRVEGLNLPGVARVFRRVLEALEIEQRVTASLGKQLEALHRRLDGEIATSDDLRKQLADANARIGGANMVARQMQDRLATEQEATNYALKQLEEAQQKILALQIEISALAEVDSV